MHRVFVYGSLKRGAERNDLLGAAVFAGEATTAAPFRMLDGPYPVLRDHGPDSHRVAGEVYEVDDTTLAALDEYEGVSERLYDRIEIDVVMTDETKPTKISRAFAYIGSADYWDHQPRQSYVTLNDRGHIDWAQHSTGPVKQPG